MQAIQPRWIRNLILSRTLIIALCLFAPVFSPAHSRTQSEDSTFRALVERYFAAYAKKDLVGVTALWSEKSPNLASYKQTLQQQYTTENLSFGLPAISRVKVESGKASLRATVTLTSTNLKNQESSEQRLARTFEFVREDGEWKVWRCAPAAEDLAEALAKTSDQAEQAKLLAEEKELVTVELGGALLAQGRRAFNQGNYTKNMEILELILKIAEQLNDRKLIATALRGIGSTRYLQGNYAQALEQIQKSLKIYEEIGDKAGLANGLNIIGLVYKAQGNYTEALEQQQKCLRIYGEINEKDGLAGSLNHIGIIYRLQGNYPQALEQYQKSLKIFEEAGSKIGIAHVLNNTGAVLELQGNYAEALEQYQRSLELYRSIGDTADIAITLGNIGNIHQELGNYPQALEQFQKSLKLHEEVGSKVGIARMLNNIGAVHQELGNYTGALEQFQKSLKIHEEIGSKIGIAGGFNSIGGIYSSQGDYVLALEQFQKSLKISEEAGDKATTASTLKDIGEVYLRQDDNNRALQFAERAADLATQIGSPGVLGEAHTIAGKAYFTLNRFNEARRSFDQAIAVIETLRANIAGGEQEQAQFFESRISPYHAMVELLISQNKPGEALVYAERAKARVLLDVLSGGRVNVTKSMTNSEIEQERKLRNQLVSLNTRIYHEKQRGGIDLDRLHQLEPQLEKARLDYEAFETNLYGAHPELKTQRGQTPPLGLDQTGTLLPDGMTALLEFVVTEKKTYLFVLSKTASVKVFPLEIKQTELKDKVERFRQMLSTVDSRFSETAHGLYDLLLKPAADEIAGKTRLVVVPDGSLWELPFQALQTPRDRYLIDDYAISYVPSLTVLREIIQASHTKEARSAAPTLLAMGNPALGTQTTTRVKAILMDEKLDPLPEAEQQVRALEKIYGPARSRIYLGPEAREERFKSEAKDFRILHLATHGILNDRSPMYSHLLLAQSGEVGKEDGILEAWELMKMEWKADLVVLSACETARGRVGKGEGMIGMTWALFVAGVPTTVVSQWKVQSGSTAELMVEFHRQLKTRRTAPSARYDAAKALQAAALKLKRDSRYQHPFYWAGFVVVGDGY